MLQTTAVVCQVGLLRPRGQTLNVDSTSLNKDDITLSKEASIIQVQYKTHFSEIVRHIILKYIIRKIIL